MMFKTRTANNKQYQQTKPSCWYMLLALFQSNVNIAQTKIKLSHVASSFQRWTNVGCDLFKFLGRHRLKVWHLAPLLCQSSCIQENIKTDDIWSRQTVKKLKSLSGKNGDRGCRQVIYWLWCWSWLRFREPYRFGGGEKLMHGIGMPHDEIYIQVICLYMISLTGLWNLLWQWEWMNASRWNIGSGTKKTTESTEEDN